MTKGAKGRYSYDRTAGANEADWVTGEVLDQRVGDKTNKQHIEAFLGQLTADGQKLHKQLAAAVKEAKKTIQGGEKVTERDVLEAVREVVSRRFGDDSLAKALAVAIATGDGFF